MGGEGAHAVITGEIYTGEPAKDSVSSYFPGLACSFLYSSNTSLFLSISPSAILIYLSMAEVFFFPFSFAKTLVLALLDIP